MKTMSTGEPHTLGTYLRIAKTIGPKAEKYMQDLVDSHEKGEDEEVVADEIQILGLLAHIQWPETKK